MLQAAQGRAEVYATDFADVGDDRPMPVAGITAIAVPVERYGARRGPNLPAIAAILVVHALLIGALIQVRNHVVRAEEAKLTVVNLSPPPPPPAAEAPPPPPSQPQVVAPPPIVQTPVPPVQIATTPDPVPAPSPVAVSAPPSPPAPVSAAPAATAAPSTIQVGDLGTQMLSRRMPRYPMESRRKREQGTVILSVIVGLDGGVESIGIARSSGFSRLDDAARDAVKHWRWHPIIRDGSAVRVKGVVEVPFELRATAA